MENAKSLALSMGMNDHGPLHAQRVHFLVGMICGVVKLTSYENDLVRAAALLHDIGMSKNREEHHIYSDKLVKDLSEKNKLPFTKTEAEVVGTLCKWHRKEYDINEYHENMEVRTGLLACLLRIADAMDLDYRRSENYLKLEPVIEHVHHDQKRHHVSVKNILGIRLYVSRTSTDVQLLIKKMENASLQVTRLIEELIDTPIAWPVKIFPVRAKFYCAYEIQKKLKAVVFSYCNAHGMIQAGISKRSLNMTGFSTTVVCDRSSTGSPITFWEDIFSQYDFSDARYVAILDLDLPDDLERFLDVVQKYPNCRWLYATPLEQSSEKIASLLEAGVEVLLGDARILYAGDMLSEDIARWIKIAGLCNADDWLASISGFSQKEFHAAQGLRYELLKLFDSNSGSDDYHEIINRIESGNIDSFTNSASNWKETLSKRTSGLERRGRVLILNQISVPGRFMYDLAHLAIEQEGFLPWENNEFATPYAICRKQLEDGRERILYLSRFSSSENFVPIKYFVPFIENQYGSGATIWQTYDTWNYAKKAIEITIDNIHRVFRCDD
jgi:hypothetical protein